MGGGSQSYPSLHSLRNEELANIKGILNRINSMKKVLKNRERHA